MAFKSKNRLCELMTFVLGGKKESTFLKWSQVSYVFKENETMIGDHNGRRCMSRLLFFFGMDDNS